MQREPESTPPGRPLPLASYEGVWCTHLMPEEGQNRLVEVIKVGRQETLLLDLFPFWHSPPKTYTLPTRTVTDPHGVLIWLGRRAELDWIHVGTNFHRIVRPTQQSSRPYPSRSYPDNHGHIDRIAGTYVHVGYMPPRFLERREGMDAVRRIDITRFALRYRESTAQEDTAWLSDWRTYLDRRDADEANEGKDPETPEVAAQALSPEVPAERSPHWARLKTE